MPHRAGTNRSRHARVTGAALAAALACAGCGPARGPVRQAVHEYVRLVQLEDPEGLYCRSAGARPEGGGREEDESGRESFRGWFRGEIDRYLEGRRDGSVDLGSSPVVLTKTFALGKGTFYALEAVRFPDDGVAQADMAVRFAYGEVDVAGLSPGTTFYLCGAPPGTIHGVRVPRVPATESRVVLETIRVRWTLLRETASGDCPEGWAVHSAEPIPGTETTRRITWYF